MLNATVETDHVRCPPGCPFHSGSWVGGGKEVMTWLGPWERTHGSSMVWVCVPVAGSSVVEPPRPRRGNGPRTRGFDAMFLRDKRLRIHWTIGPPSRRVAQSRRRHAEWARPRAVDELNPAEGFREEQDRTHQHGSIANAQRRPPPGSKVVMVQQNPVPLSADMMPISRMTSSGPCWGKAAPGPERTASMMAIVAMARGMAVY